MRALSYRPAIIAGMLALVTPAMALAQAVVKADGSYEYPNYKYKNSTQQYEALKRAANGGTKHTVSTVPDWSGTWTHADGGTRFDPLQRVMDEKSTTAKLTPKYQALLDQKMKEVRADVEWDRLSYCLPAGFPRWLTEPFLRDFVARPEETWLMNEMQNETRRIYTDGRAHTPADEAYPLWNGDSIGFWRGNTLVIHTTQLREGQYNRRQPDYSDKVETVEEWTRTSPDMMTVDVTVYDPESLLEPWHVVKHYERVKEPQDLRIRLWSCEENNNVVNQSGVTQFVLPGETGYKDPKVFGTTAPAK
jgi:hypothetical protein